MRVIFRIAEEPLTSRDVLRFSDFNRLFNQLFYSSKEP
jgi:hypothetical protein